MPCLLNSSYACPSLDDAHSLSTIRRKHRTYSCMPSLPPSVISNMHLPCCTQGLGLHGAQTQQHVAPMQQVQRARVWLQQKLKHQPRGVSRLVPPQREWPLFSRQMPAQTLTQITRWSLRRRTLMQTPSNALEQVSLSCALFVCFCSFYPTVSLVYPTGTP